MIITLDGMDGVGKTTIAHALAEEIRVKYKREVQVVKLPTRDIPKYKSYVEEVDQYLMNIFTCLASTIVPLAEKGVVVICDRWISSTFLYQSFNGHGRYADFVSAQQVFAYIANELKDVRIARPDLCVYLTKSEEACMKTVWEERGEEPELELYRHVSKWLPLMPAFDNGRDHLTMKAFEKTVGRILDYMSLKGVL